MKTRLMPIPMVVALYWSEYPGTSLQGICHASLLCLSDTFKSGRSIADLSLDDNHIYKTGTYEDGYVFMSYMCLSGIQS